MDFVFRSPSICWKSSNNLIFWDKLLGNHWKFENMENIKIEIENLDVKAAFIEVRPNFCLAELGPV